jgi:hypothetical protein
MLDQHCWPLNITYSSVPDLLTFTPVQHVLLLSFNLKLVNISWELDQIKVGR